MNVALLAEYVEISKWRVKRHLKPRGFKKLKQDQLAAYAKVLGVSAEELLNYKPTN